jgi:hypothetical protein
MPSQTIKISDETKTMLDKVKHLGQTYDGIIQELIINARIVGVKDKNVK